MGTAEVSEGRSEVVASAEGTEEVPKGRSVGTEEASEGWSEVVAPTVGTEEVSKGRSEVVASAAQITLLEPLPQE